LPVPDYLRNPWVVRISSFILFFVAWQLLADYVSPLTFATPGETGKRFYELWVSGEMPTAIVDTLQSIVVGFALGVAVAIPVGLLMGTSRTAEYGLDPYVNLIYATPIIVIIPIVAVVLGSNMLATYLIVFLASVFPILINVMAGVKSVGRDMLETSNSFGMKGWGLWRNVIFPSALPYTMAGLRIGVGHAVVGAILAELFLYGVGLGGMIYDYSGIFDTGAMIAAVVVVMVIGVGLTEGVKYFEKRFLGWSLTAHGTR
jgi:ABC-type nitrate/sulfonate/bicarbonate transport system permease component